MIIISVATIVFFISLYVDIEQLSSVLKWLLYLIPYTHASLFIKFVALDMLREALTHLTILLLVIAGLMYVSIKLFNEERIIYGKT